VSAATCRSRAVPPALFGALAVLLVVAPAPRGGETACEKDVAFALPQLEQKCGALLAKKKVDWKRVGAEISAAAKRAKDDSEHLRVLMRLVARLKDGHAEVRPTAKGKAVELPADLRAPRGGLGIFLCRIGDKLVVKNSFGEAQKAGIKAGMELKKVDGKAASDWIKARAAELADTECFSTGQQALFFACHQGLSFPKGRRVALTLADASGKALERTLTCDQTNQVPWGPLAIPADAAGGEDVQWWRTKAGIGVIHLRRCKSDLPEQVEAALVALGRVPGIVLDFRGNSGGSFDHEALMVRFVPAGKRLAFDKKYESAGKVQYGGPVVVIVDATVRSAAESGSGIFKEDGRALLIGESATAGMSSSKETLALPSGLFELYFSVASNMGRFNQGEGIEGIGVAPHELVSYAQKDLEAGVDTLLARAEALLAGFPNEPAWQRAKVPTSRPNSGGSDGRDVRAVEHRVSSSPETKAGSGTTPSDPAQAAHAPLASTGLGSGRCFFVGVDY
jgi:carboxyl-terminal processing protease